MAAGKLLKQGIEHHSSGDISKALSYYAKALKIDPSHAHSLRLSGLAKLQLGAFEEAIDFLEKAVVIDETQVEALSNLGLAYTQSKNYQAALTSLSKAQALAPSNLQVLNNLGVLYRHLNRNEDAIQLFESIFRSNPDAFMALNNLAFLYDFKGEYKIAENYAKKAIALNPKEKSSMQTLAAIYTHQYQYKKADSIFRKLLSDEGSIENRFHFALMLAESGKMLEAMELYKSILCDAPNNTEAQWNLSLALLKCKDFVSGWKLYRNFWNKNFSRPLVSVNLPWWSKKTPSTANCLIRAEQGIGDEIMFASLLLQMLKKHNSITLECDTRLQPIFERSFPGLKTIAKNKKIINTESYQVQARVADLCLNFRKNPSEFIPHTGYLKACKTTTAHFQKAHKIKHPEKLLVGFSWKSGNKQNGHQRSISLTAWEPLLNMEGISWFNCQYGPYRDATKNLNTNTQMQIYKAPCDQLTDLDTYISFISTLDLIISIDNSNVHLAGALGIPVWVLLNHNADWRWGLSDDKSYWYPSATLIRQEKPGEWLASLSKVQKMLIEHLKERHCI